MFVHRSRRPYGWAGFRKNGKNRPVRQACADCGRLAPRVEVSVYKRIKNLDFDKTMAFSQSHAPPVSQEE
jgi:hypothetical protein